MVRLGVGSWFWFLVLGRFGFGIDSIGISTVDGTWDGILGGGWGALGWDVGCIARVGAKSEAVGFSHRQRAYLLYISRPPLNSRAELEKKRHTQNTQTQSTKHNKHTQASAAHTQHTRPRTRTHTLPLLERF